MTFRMPNEERVLGNRISLLKSPEFCHFHYALDVYRTALRVVPVLALPGFLFRNSCNPGGFRSKAIADVFGIAVFPGLKNDSLHRFLILLIILRRWAMERVRFICQLCIRDQPRLDKLCSPWLFVDMPFAADKSYLLARCTKRMLHST